MKCPFDSIVLFIILLSDILNLKQYSDCKAPLGIMMVTLWSAVLSFQLSTKMVTSRGCTQCLGIFLMGLAALVFPAALLLGTTCLVYVTVKSPKCAPPSLLIVDWTILVLGDLLLLVGICLVVWVIKEQNRNKRKAEERKLKFEQLYEQIFDENFDVEKYFLDNIDIDSYKFTDKEVEILMDFFGREFEEDQTGKDENELRECTICIDRFEKGTRYLKHPKCNHEFHPHCIGEWFKKSTKDKTECPICACPTRSNMIRAMHSQFIDQAGRGDRAKVSIEPAKNHINSSVATS